VWGLQDTIDRVRFAAECAVIGVVEHFADGDMEDRKPFAMTLDGYRYIVFPDPTSESAANATLVVQNIETGEEVAHCPGQLG
jgi:hypothetical protein